MLNRSPAITFSRVSVTYPGGVRALHGLDLDLPAESITAVMGGSGSGKSTLLRLINSLLAPDPGGAVRIDGEPVDAFDQVALRRSIGYVIQEGGLFPHWTAERNVGLVPELLGIRGHSAESLVTTAMDMARIPRDEFGRRLPGTLSGGQRQRVAIARAIAARPRTLLLDEPFSALDPAVRGELQAEVRDLARRLGMTVVMVTHDIAEACAVADRIVLIDAGRLVQVGTPVQICLQPADRVAAAFTARQALELRLRHLRLGDVADHLEAVAGEPCAELGGDRAVADALAALAREGGERFTVLHRGVRLGPFDRRNVWDLLQRGLEAA
ncbi:MAG: hypothetical protein RLZZ127_1798 [Planctomycetota bacterium]|jgi:osmoprotectant transport system ATP-binding protein